MNDTEFPPFVPAKPKGGVAAEIEVAKRDKSRTTIEMEVVDKPKRKRRTAAELEAAGVKKKKPKPRGTTIPLDALPAFCGLSMEEAEQVVVICEALQTFPKGSRTRIAEAIGKIELPPGSRVLMTLGR